ncbi:MAG: DUF4070 domain-containing protein, partial [Candidatus Eisenbacteria bacterium]|nr:DUF4070 domain-containing protein [Candidatus Latescibacterota bacterium]MBD3302098.1 DUF4070 domain-containing protein [Candidatus Eisenbacteria bacterium]
MIDRSKSPNTLLVNPRFGLHSFWNYRETCEVVGARHVATPLGLITVAALLPEEWPVRLVDCNIEELRDDDLQWADLIMIGGMLSQQRGIRQIMERARDWGKPIVVGGPDVTASPEVYADADFRVLGEAEESMADFVAAWHAGRRSGTFEASSFPDLERSPLPRFDLLKLEHYMHVGVQFSRGCPYRCEFCNVIELNGRVPRFKSEKQMLSELESLHQLGYRGHIDFVDDNLIGNRKAARPFLAALGDWNERHGRPFEYSSEASLNLADDGELLALMRRAGFFAVFIGIESPDPQTLLSTYKTQNASRDVATSLRKIYRAGMIVNAGFIVGLDGETDSVAPAMIACIEEAAIPLCMVGLLYALPNTRLAHRLCAEGRLHEGFDRPASDDDTDQCTSGLNFLTLRPRKMILAEYRTILHEIYEPRAFFRRVRRVARALDLSGSGLRSPLGTHVRNLRSFVRISTQMGIRNRQTRLHYWRALWDCLR